MKMLLDQRDVDVLRLIGLCKDIPADCSPIQSDMFSQAEFSALAGAGYIQKSKSKLSYRLTDKGVALLKQLDYPVQRDKHPVGAGGVLSRRLDVAKVILTVYRAAIPFWDKAKNIFFPSIVFRRKGGSEVLGSSRMCGIFLFSDQMKAVYFVNKDTKLNVNVELAAIRRLKALYKSDGITTFVYFAESQDIADTYESPFEGTSSIYPWGDSLCTIQNWPVYEPEALPLEVSIYS